MHSRRLEVSAGHVPSRLAGKDSVRINSEQKYVAMASHLAQNLRRSTKSDQKKKSTRAEHVNSQSLLLSIAAETKVSRHADVMQGDGVHTCAYATPRYQRCFPKLCRKYNAPTTCSFHGILPSGRAAVGLASDCGAA